MTSTNFIDGVTNVSADATLGSFPSPDPSRTFQFFDDFTTFWGSATGPSDWLVTNTNTTVGGAVVTDANRGILLITNTAADNDAYRAQWQGGNTSDTALIYQHVANRESWFKTRFAVNTEILQSDVIIGAYPVDADPVTAIVDGFIFNKADGSAVLNFQSVVGGVVTTVPVATLVAGTFVDVGWYYNANGAFDIFVNDLRVAGSLPAAISTALITPSFAFQNGEAVAKVMQLDYMLLAQNR